MRVRVRYLVLMLKLWDMECIMSLTVLTERHIHKPNKYIYVSENEC